MDDRQRELPCSCSTHKEVPETDRLVGSRCRERGIDDDLDAVGGGKVAEAIE